MRFAFERRRLIALAGAAMVGAAGLILLRPDEAPAPPMFPPPTVAAPIPLPPELPAAPSPVAASTAGLQLKGVLGFSGGAGAAIFGFPDGRQRLVSVGREVTPGVRLESIGAAGATVHDGAQRLEFALPELQAAAGAPTAPVAVGEVVDPKRDLANFRLGLKPEGDSKRPRGYRVAGGVPLPGFERAGLRAGDLLLAVNGQSLDEERLLDLPAELAAATSVEIAYERDGQRLTAKLR